MTKQNVLLKMMPITSHLKELRKRVIISLLFLVTSSSICYSYAAEICALLIAPLAEVYKNDAISHKLIYTGLSEAFFVYLKTAIYSGIYLSFPMFALQTYLFVKPGLYAHEKKAFAPYIIIAPVLFTLGAALAYFYVIPMAWKFFTSFEHHDGNSLPLVLETRVSEYFSLTLSLLIGFGIAFQLPMILVLLTHMSWLNPELLVRYRRHAIVAIFFIAAILTPPDVISQVMLAIPLMFLYELAILICKKIVKQRGKGV